ncbi:MAG: amidohydrolase [Thermodesulfobacteriota bacterium]
MSERLVLWNAEFITMDRADTRATALAVEDGRILRVGDAEEVKDLLDQGWPSLDLDGRTVLPGFIDTHNHFMLTGLLSTAVDLAGAADLAEALERIAQGAARTGRGDWVRAGNLNELDLREQRLPTRDDLDRVCSDKPVFVLHATGHLCVFNSKGFEAVKPPLGLPGLDLSGGRPTGVVRDPGILTFIHPAMSRLIPKETRVEALEAAAEAALRQGVTTVHALDGGDLGPGDTRLICQYKDRLPLRVVSYNQSMDLAEVEELGLPRVGGCICADGAFEAHTAALFEPYLDEPDNYGALTFTQEVMDDFILRAHKAGLQIAVHCESERSIEQVLWAMEKALRAFPRADHRHRIEHFELPTWNQIERLARAGIIASMQPAFIPAFIGPERMERYEVLLGRARLDRVHPYRTILDHQVPLCGGSDSPVTPYAPLRGIMAAVDHPNPDQRVTVREALEMFTSTAAWAAFEEHEKGTLEPGKLADLVVLDESPYMALDIAALRVESVYVGGRPHRPR